MKYELYSKVSPNTQNSKQEKKVNDVALND
jgi:hypothetical protein